MPVGTPDEDLFEESRMSFGEHLEELRRVLVRSLYGVVIGCAIGFYLANDVINFLQQPLNKAIATFKIEQSMDRLQDENGFVPPEMSQRMKSQRMLPKSYLVDPGEIVQLIRELSPDALGDIDLTPYRFHEQEFPPQSAQAVAKRWVAAEENDAERSQLELLWSLLDEDDRTLVQQIADGQDGDDSGQQVEQLLPVLNRLIENPAIHNSEEFSKWLAQPGGSLLDSFEASFTGKRVDQSLYLMKVKLDEADGPQPDLNRRLNHILVSSAFARELNPPDIPMASIRLWEPAEVNAQSLKAEEVFMVWLKAGLITGLFVSSPWLFYQVWSFVAAGLYKHEQRYVYIYMPISLLLFFSGAALSFFFVFEPVLGFLFSFNAGMGIDPQPRIGDWLSFVMFLPLGFGISFQLPLVMLALNRIGILEIGTYLKQWRMAVLVIFVISMLLTPADPISMLLMALPLSGLYFLGIAMCRWMPGRRSPFGEEVYEP